MEGQPTNLPPLRRRRRNTVPIEGSLVEDAGAVPLFEARSRLPPLSRSTLDFLGTIPRNASLDSLTSLLERRGRESLRAADEKAQEVFHKARHRYLAHELLLLAFYQRRSAATHPPLTRTRPASTQTSPQGRPIPGLQPTHLADSNARPL